MLRLTIVFLCLTSFSHVFGCECVNGKGRNFLNNIDKFDAIVLGSININDNKYNPTLTITKVYKGDVNKNMIELSTGGFCDNNFNFESGTLVILGLVNSDYEGNPYTAPGCLTSSIIVEGANAFTPEDQPPMFKKPRIGIFTNSMKLHRLEKRIISKVN